MFFVEEYRTEINLLWQKNEKGVDNLSLFGTDGVRGKVNQELTAELALKLGKAGGLFLSKKAAMASKKVLIGRDTRVSGTMLEGALAAGLASSGLDVHLLGVLPTSGVAYLCAKHDYCGGIMISASHNPPEDNGIKFFDYQGCKLSDQEESAVENLINQSVSFSEESDLGQVSCHHNLIEDYLEFLKQVVEVDFSDVKVVLDLANGASYQIAPQVWEELGATVIAINATKKGDLINVNCGSTHPEKLQKTVVASGADLGFAFDGDADRVIACDSEGRLLDGDYIMAICGKYFLETKTLPNNTVVATAYSNRALKEMLIALGGDLAEAANGDRYVLQLMQEKSYIFGGEKSGHIIFSDYNQTGDGVLTSLKLTEVMKKQGMPLHKLRDSFQPFPQELANIQVANKDFSQNEAIKKIVQWAEKEMSAQGRVFIRASGTESVIRVMVEGPNQKQLKEIVKSISVVIDRELN